MVWSNQGANTLVFPPGATTGQRLVIGFDATQNAEGIFAYDSNNNLVFALYASSSTTPVTMGLAPIVAGSVPGSIWWTDSFTGGHAALYETTTKLTILQSGWDAVATDHMILELASGSANGQPLAYLGLAQPVAGRFYSGFVTARGFSTNYVSSNTIDAIFIGNNSANGIIFFTTLRGAQIPGSASGYIFGLGLTGKYYYEQGNVNQSVGSNALTGLTVTPQWTFSDYNLAATSQWAGNTWTAPDTAVYRIHVTLLGYSAASYIAYTRITQNGVNILNVGSGTANIVGNLAQIPIAIELLLFLGDTIQVTTIQVSGAAQTVTGIVSIARTL